MPKASFGEGDFIDDPFGMDGGNAVTKIRDLRTLMRIVTLNCLEHHVNMVRGHHAEIFPETATRYLGCPICHPNSIPEPRPVLPNRF